MTDDLLYWAFGMGVNLSFALVCAVQQFWVAAWINLAAAIALYSMILVSLP